MFLPAQVQVAQAAVELQAFGQPLHPGVRHPHLPQVELQQAAVHRQHLREVHRPLLLRHAETDRSDWPCVMNEMQQKLKETMERKRCWVFVLVTYR